MKREKVLVDDEELTKLEKAHEEMRQRINALSKTIADLESENRSIRRALNVAGNENRTLRRLQGQQQAPGHNVAEDEELERNARAALSRAKVAGDTALFGVFDVLESLIAARWGKE